MLQPLKLQFHCNVDVIENIVFCLYKYWSSFDSKHISSLAAKMKYFALSFDLVLALVILYDFWKEKRFIFFQLSTGPFGDQ